MISRSNALSLQLGSIRERNKNSIAASTEISKLLEGIGLDGNNDLALNIKEIENLTILKEAEKIGFDNRKKELL